MRGKEEMISWLGVPSNKQTTLSYHRQDSLEIDHEKLWYGCFLCQSGWPWDCEFPLMDPQDQCLWILRTLSHSALCWRQAQKSLFSSALETGGLCSHFWLWRLDQKPPVEKLPDCTSLLGIISRALAGCNVRPPPPSTWSCPTWIVTAAFSWSPCARSATTWLQSILPRAAWVRSCLSSAQKALTAVHLSPNKIYTHHSACKTLDDTWRHLTELLKGLRATPARRSPPAQAVLHQPPTQKRPCPPPSCSTLPAFFLGGPLGIGPPQFKSWLSPFSSCVTLASCWISLCLLPTKWGITVPAKKGCKDSIQRASLVAQW